MERKNKIWFVTGSGNGLGRDIVEQALKSGDKVVATARDLSKLEDLVAEFGDSILPVVLDVSNEQAAEDAVALALSHFGTIDVLVNNAGYGDNKPFEQVSSEDFRRLIETNFFGVVTLTRAVLPIMRKQKSGHIIQISSAGGRMAIAGNAAYHASKWAIGGFTEGLAQEVSSFGVKVTAIEPGGMRTNWGKRAFGNNIELLPEYEATIGATTKFLESYWGHENSDPKKVAEVILKVAESQELPPHILIGSDALDLVKQASDKRWKDAEAWRTFSEYADFDNKKVIPDFLKKS